MSKPPIPPIRLFTLRSTLANSPLEIAAHTVRAKGTPAGWLLTFSTIIGVESDEFGDWYEFSRRLVTFPIDCVWDVSEERITAGMVH